MRKNALPAVVVLLGNIMVLCYADVATAEFCSISSNSCQLSEMKFQLQKAMNFTSRAIEILNEGKKSRSCPTHPEDCEAVYRCGYRTSDVYTVWPRNRVLKNSIQAYCDMDTDGGGWTVIQRRGDFGRAQDYFFNDWNTYKEGFGDISQDFWLGNDLLFAFTNQKLHTLRFDLKDLEGTSRSATYDKFWVDSEEYNYTLHVHGYRGNAGDSFTQHNGKQFTSKDRDNDFDPGRNCALIYKGAWWYDKCHVSNLNGFYLNGTHTSFADGIEWYSWRGYNYSLPFTEMKIRSLFFKANENHRENETPM